MLIVARYMDGRLVKGSTTSFNSAHTSFFVAPPSGGRRARVLTDGMKAVFCVRSLEGNPSRPDHREFPNQEGRLRPKRWLCFRDGERMPAWPVSPILGREGFWVLPTDMRSNLEKAYVFRRSLEVVLEGTEAEEEARAVAREISRECRGGRFPILDI